MVFKDFRFRLIVRIGLLVLFIFLASWLLQNNKTFMLGLIFVPLSVIQFFVLYYFVEKTNSEVLNFLSSIQYDDFSVNYPTKMHSGYTKKLHESFNQIIIRFKALRAEKESHLQFYKAVLHQIDFGVLAFNNTGEIKICNNTALRLLGLNRLHNINVLKNTHPEIYVALITILPRQKKVLKLSHETQRMSIAVSVIEMIANGEPLKLLSIQNIQTELEEKEMEAWQNMIKVMTHEMMNSLTPITSLASTISDEISTWNNADDTPKTISSTETKELLLAISTIKKRSEGLLRFVEDFRVLSQIPKPKPKLFPLKPFFEHLIVLTKNESEKQLLEINISLEPSSIQLMADSMLIEQLMINMLKNAIESFPDIEHSKKIEIRAFYNSESKIEIWVQDNGIGIVPEVLEKVFIPFYSTKKTGSGIGLTISKQIMRSHSGVIKINSEYKKGTIVKLIF